MNGENKNRSIKDMVIVAYPDGTNALGDSLFINTKQAKLAADRKLNDPPVRAYRLSHFRPKTWEEKGYRIICYQSRPELDG